LHDVVQAPQWWRARHRQRQWQRWQHQLTTIGWQLRAEKANWGRAGTWIVPPPLTFAEIGKSSQGTCCMPEEMSGKFRTLPEVSQASPSDMETWDWGFDFQDIAEIMRLLWEMSLISREHTTRCQNCGKSIGDYGLSHSMATESRYITNSQQRTVLKVDIEEVLWARYARLEGYSGWMWRGWMWSGWM
jgi:hypothetical protein